MKFDNERYLGIFVKRRPPAITPSRQRSWQAHRRKEPRICPGHPLLEPSACLLRKGRLERPTISIRLEGQKADKTQIDDEEQPG